MKRITSMNHHHSVYISQRKSKSPRPIKPEVSWHQLRLNSGTFTPAQSSEVVDNTLNNRRGPIVASHWLQQYTLKKPQKWVEQKCILNCNWKRDMWKEEGGWGVLAEYVWVRSTCVCMPVYPSTCTKKELTSNSLRGWILGVNRKESISTAKGGFQPWNRHNTDDIHQDSDKQLALLNHLCGQHHEYTC